MDSHYQSQSLDLPIKSEEELQVKQLLEIEQWEKLKEAKLIQAELKLQAEETRLVSTLLTQAIFKQKLEHELIELQIMHRILRIETMRLSLAELGINFGRHQHPQDEEDQSFDEQESQDQGFAQVAAANDKSPSQREASVAEDVQNSHPQLNEPDAPDSGSNK